MSCSGRGGKNRSRQGLASALVAHLSMQRSVAGHDTVTSIMPLVYDLIEVPVSINVPSSNNLSTTAIIDGGSMINVMSPMLAAEAGLKVEPLPNLSSHGVNKTVPVTIYGHTNVLLDIQDTTGTWKTCDVPFVVLEDPSKPVLLGAPWLAMYSPKLDHYKRTMRFARKRGDHRFKQIDVCSARTFQCLVNTKMAEVYSCHISDILGPEQPQSLPECYKDYADVFSEEESAQLSENGPFDLAIELEDGKQPPYSPMYNLSENELVVLREYLRKYLERGWIRHSRSPAGAPILFAKKKDGSLRLCVDYRALNNITIKNRHPLPLIQESLERLGNARIYTRLDLREAYHRLRIKKGDEWKTAFRTRYGHFEYLVVPFGLTNAPAAFQAYINRALSDLVDRICVVYLDDILIYSRTAEDHVEHVRMVLDRLREYKLYAKLEKCEFHTQQTEYLGYIVTPDGLSIDTSRVATIQEWPEPTSVREIRIFVGFVNYYRRFVHNFSRIVAPLNEMTKKGPGCARGGHAQRREESVELELTPEARRAFETLKQAFLKVPILGHYDPNKECRVETDASGNAICGILSQADQSVGGKIQWRPVAFYSRKMSSAERNYDTHDHELLAIVESLKEWRRYLEGSTRSFDLYTDHDNLRYFLKTKTLSRRQARWAEGLAEFHFSIIHRAGRRNPADGPSRRPDYANKDQDMLDDDNPGIARRLAQKLGRRGYVPEGQVEAADSIVSLEANLTVTTDEVLEDIEDFQSRGLRSEARQAGELCVAVAHATRRKGSKTEGETSPRGPAPDSQSRSSEVKGKTFLEYLGSDSSDESEDMSESESEGQNAPEEVFGKRERDRVTRLAHGDPMAGHFGVKRTLEKIRRRFFWKGMREDVKKYIKECVICQRAKIRRRKKIGLLNPLPEPDGPWQWITMDFITDLPPSRLNENVYDSILVIVDRFSKMVHYIPSRKDVKAQSLARTFMHEVIRLHGVPEIITSDRGSVMTSQFWRTFWEHLSSHLTYTTSYHPESDGQTERQNATLEEYLRCYCSFEQDDWVLWLDVAEFAYNDSPQASTGFTPFEVNLGRHPNSGRWPTTGKKGRAPPARDLAAKLVSLHKELRTRLIKANQQMKKQYDKHHRDVTFEKGEQVLLANKWLKSLRPKRKLDYRYRGPFKVLERIGANAYRIQLPKGSRAYNVFHVSMLEKYYPPSDKARQKEMTPDDWQIEDDNVYDVERIDGQELGKDGIWLYKVIWKGYPESEATLEPAVNIGEGVMQEYLKKRRSAENSRKRPAEEEPTRRGRGRPRKRRRGK